MKIIRRPLAPGETDLELLFAPILAISLAGVLLVLKTGWPLPGCPFAAWTQQPCLSCGVTRALEALSHGHWREAFLWNPLALVSLILLLLWMGYAAAVAGRRTPRLRLIGFTTTSRVILLALVLINWSYLLFRHE